ncbi:MAG: tRNA (adenine-N1)-methyltransferase [Candidatus Saliniplasma sp.]
MIKEGEKVILWKKNWMTLVEVNGETKKVSGLGIIDTNRMIGQEWGSLIELGRDEYRLLQPAIKDAEHFLKRDAQIILPRIGIQIAFYCDLFCGDNVIEGGAGSGLLTSVLGKCVGKDGKVITYELREDHIKTARSNIKKLGLEDRCEIVHGDVTEDVEERGADAFIVDIPEPWNAVSMANEVLKGGGFFAGYIPSMNQLEKTVKELRKHNYIDIKSFENLEREMIVKEKGVRPSFDMLGHTGYVIVGRRPNGV